MQMKVRGATLATLTVLCFATVAAPAQNRKELKYTVQPGASLSIINDQGPITVRPATGRQVLVSITLRSNKVELDQSQTGNRIELRTHLQPGTSGDAARVDYEVSAPADVAVTLRSGTGAITVERMRGDVTLEGDNTTIDVRDVSNAHVHVRSMGGPVRLSNITNGHVEITSVSGAVELKNVSGPKLEVNTTSGRITYAGDFGSGGDYSFTNHNGDIDVFVPASASANISARSVKGSVENEIPVAPKVHAPGFAAQADAGRAFAGTINSGASSVQIRSFSGKIRVKKQ